MTNLGRLLSIVALTAVAVCVVAQGLNQKVSYTTVAVPIDRALKELGAIAKVKFEAANEVQGEIVVINVHGVVLDDLMKRIATATSCKWKTTSDGIHVLFRPSEIARAEEDQELAVRVAEIRKAVADLGEGLKKHPVMDAKTADELTRTTTTKDDEGAVTEHYADVGNQPANRATARLLALADPKTLAAMGESERIVYSTRPNRMQLAMGREAIDVVKTMVAEQAVWAEAYRRRRSEKAKDGTEEVAIRYAGQNYDPIDGAPDKALICIRKEREPQGYEVRLRLYDGQGKQIFEGGESMSVGSDLEARMEQLLKSQPPTDDMEIELSPDSKEMLRFFRSIVASMEGGGAPKDLSSDLVAKLRRPDKYDPLGFIHSEAMMAAANAADANLVADVPDKIMAAVNFIMPGQKLTVKSFIKALSSGDLVTMETKDSWMLVRPARPYMARAKRLDREALAQLIQASQATGTLALDDLAAYALKNESLMSTEVSQLYSILVLPGTALNVGVLGGADNDWNMLRLYSTLTEVQRRVLGSGQSIAIRGLLQAQSNLVFRLTYFPDDSGSQLRVQHYGPPTPGENLPSPDAGSDAEPTELLPDGVPPDGFITVQLKNTAIVKDAGARQPVIRLFDSLDPDQLAMFRGMKSEPTMSGAAGLLFPSLEKFRIGVRTTYDFFFHFTPGVLMTQQLQDTHVDPKGPVVDFANLPEEFRMKAARQEEEMRRDASPPDVSGGGGPIKP